MVRAPNMLSDAHSTGGHQGVLVSLLAGGRTDPFQLRKALRLQQGKTIQTASTSLGRASHEPTGLP
jgi:hypothetical protein